MTDKLFKQLRDSFSSIRYGCRMAGVSSNEDVEDVQTQIMIRFMSSTETQIPNRLIIVSAYRFALSLQRDRKRQISVVMNSEDSERLYEQVEDSRFKDFINRDLLFKAIEALDPQDQDLIRLYLHDFTYEEMAVALGKKVGWCKGAVSGARDKLAKSLGVERVKDKTKAHKTRRLEEADRALEDMMDDFLTSL